MNGLKLINSNVTLTDLVPFSQGVTGLISGQPWSNLNVIFVKY